MATSYLDLNGLKHLWEKAEKSFSPIDTKAEDIYAEGIGDTTVSGNPVVLNDVPYEQDASSLSVSFEPIQDFNGYDYPWPPGGGKNKYPGGDVSEATQWKVLAIDSIPAGSYTISGVAQSSDIDSNVCRIIMNHGTGAPATSIVDTTVSRGTAFSYSFTVSDTIDEIIFYASNNKTNGANDTFSFTNVQIESGSSATTYEPYSNICPISGRTEMKVERCGKNLLPNKLNQQTSTTVVLGQTEVFQTPTISLNAGTYTLTVNSTVNGSIYIFSDNGLNSRIGTTPTASFTLSEDDKISLRLYLANGFDASAILNFQLELGSTATSYEPYTGETYDITFPTEAGTVYGGTLDMLSGVLTVDKAITNLWSQSIPYHWQRLDTSEVGKYRFGNGFLASVIKKPDSLDTIANAKCSALPIIAGNQPILNKTGIGVHTNGNIIVYADIYSTMTVDEFENAMSDVQFVYELATPQTYQLDPHTLSLLKGYNYISSDSNIKEITVKYQGESDSTIQNELSEHEEEIRNINQSISSLTSYNIIADGSGETTISGNEINISDAIGGNAISLTANVSMGQITEEAETVSCGSGTCIVTPLEDPYSSVDIIVKNGINQTKNTVALGTTIGNGIIDIVNGVGVQSYEYQLAMSFSGKGAANQTDAYYIQTNQINVDIQNKCLCNIGANNPSSLTSSYITSPVYGYMASYPNLFFIAFPKSFGLSTIELVNEFLAQIGGAQILIPLATPTSFSFLPHNISLFQKNNIITGGRGTELLELTYESSTSSNVQIELNKQSTLLNNIVNDIAPVEKSTAIENHAVGDYIILNGKFCKVTTAIATGEIITIGINVSQTTISAEILAILSQQSS